MTTADERDFWQRAAAVSAQRLALTHAKLDAILSVFEGWRQRGEPLPSFGELDRLLREARDT